VGISKSQTRKWFDAECKSAIGRRGEARQSYLRSSTPEAKELFEQERRLCKRTLQREKISYMNVLLSSTEQDYSQGMVRNFFARIRKFKKYNPTLKAV